MLKFTCTNRRQSTGINWCVESRIYTLYPTFWSRFSNIRHVIELNNVGEFYFPETTNSLPQCGDINMGSKLHTFHGKQIFKWLVDNSNSKVSIWCKRDYGLTDFGDYDKFNMTVSFASESDLLAFKLWWY